MQESGDASPETASTAMTGWQLKFFPIWTGQAFSLLGSRVVQFALVWWLTTLTGSATVLATATMVGLLPEILLGPIAGAYVDRWNRRAVMIVADGLIALASLALAYLFWIDAVQVWHIYVIMLIRSIGGSFHYPAMAASTSLMVPRQHLTRVAGLNQTLYGMLSIFGPPLGALAMQWLPFYDIMLIDVFTAMIAIAPLLFVSIPQPQRQETGAARPSIWTDMRDGLRYLLGWRGMMIVIGAALIFKLAMTPAFSLLPLLVSDHFGGDAVQLSLLETVLGAGIVLGGLALSVWGGFRRRVYTMLFPLLISGLCVVVIGLTPSTAFWLAVAAAFAIGLLMPPIDGTFMAILQGNVAPELQGRVFSLIGSLLTLSSPVGLALAGPVSDALGLQVWYIIGGVLTSAVAVALFFVPAVVNIEQGRPPAPASLSPGGEG
jgi:DHA3 family macrolide efflux protein-like MFS transporter